MNLVNQLLDFRKINSGINILQVSRNDLCVSCKNINALPGGHLECQAVSVSGIHDCIDILNVYNALHNVPADEYIFYLQ